MSISREEPTVDDVEAFLLFLIGGEIPGHITLSDPPPKMTVEQANGVIYVLQEFLHVIPDTYELCDFCHGMFNTECEGHVGTYGEAFCSGCCHICACKECTEAREEDV